MREINSLGFFRNVRVYTDESDKGRIVIFEVDENPVVRQISISGNENVVAPTTTSCCWICDPSA